DLSERGVRLLGRGRVDAGADTATLWRALERWALRLRPRALTPVSDQLLHSWHASLVFNLVVSPSSVPGHPGHGGFDPSQDLERILRVRVRPTETARTARTATENPTEGIQVMSTRRPGQMPWPEGSDGQSPGPPQLPEERVVGSGHPVPGVMIADPLPGPFR